MAAGASERRGAVDDGEAAGAAVGVTDAASSAASAAAFETRRRPLVLLHGFGQHGDAWEPAAGLLRAAGFDVRTPDLADLARRAAASGADAVSLDAVCRGVADEVRRIVGETGCRPVLVGYSLGGRIALEAALRCGVAGAVDAVGAAVPLCAAAAPSRIFASSCAASSATAAPFAPLPLSALVLESAGLGPADDADRAQLRERNAAWAARARAEGVAAFMNWWEGLPLFASQRALPEAARARLRAGRLRNTPDGLAAQLEAWGQHHQAGRASALVFLSAAAQAGFPVAYLAGALDAKYCAAAEAVRAAVPDARVRVVPGVGHNIHLEAPAAFAAELASFLETTGVSASPALP